MVEREDNNSGSKGLLNLIALMESFACGVAIGYDHSHGSNFSHIFNAGLLVAPIGLCGTLGHLDGKDSNKNYYLEFGKRKTQLADHENSREKILAVNLPSSLPTIASAGTYSGLLVATGYLLGRNLPI